MARSPYALDASSLARMLDSSQSAVIRFDRPGCVDCGALNPFFTQLAGGLPDGSVYVANCERNPEICDGCGVSSSSDEPPEPLIKAWTGTGFVTFRGERSTEAVVNWLQRLDRVWDEAEEELPPAVAARATAASEFVEIGATGTASRPTVTLRPWPGQGLPSQLFLPSAPLTGRAAETGLRPVLVFLHGGTDGPFEALNSQSLPNLLLRNATFAASWPFITIFPCSECDREGKMQPFHPEVWEGGHLKFGEVGWTPRNMARVDAMIDTALRRFGGDPQRVVLGGHSYGGRGILWYAAARTRTFAALVPVCPSSGPTPKVVDALCCASGEAHCCPPVWQFVGANDHRMIVDFNDEWARRLQAQRQRPAAPRYTRYDGAPTVNGHMHGHGAGEWALREPELYAWMEAQVCAGCVGPTASGGYVAVEEAARTISGPSKLPDEDLGYGLRRDTPVPEGVEVYAREPAADSI